MMGDNITMNEILKDDIRIDTIEIRQFVSPLFKAPIEVEFHRNPPWKEMLSYATTFSTKEKQIDGAAILHLAARTAITGLTVPPISIFQHPGEHVLLDEQDIFDLSITIAKFSAEHDGIPTSDDHSDAYLSLRSKIEDVLGLQHTHLGIRSSKRRESEERQIEAVAHQLGEHAIAFSSSPDLSFQKFIEIVGKNRNVFGFSASADVLLGSSALSSAYQLAIAANPVLAIELASAGASAYMILKFGAAVGKKVEQLIRKL